MQIQFTYDQATGSLPAGMVEALDVAASYFDHLFANPITLHIEVGYGEITQFGQSTAITSGAEGGSVDDALWTYAQTLQTYSSHITSPDQQSAYSELAATATTGGQIDVSSAQQKAFGQSAANGSASDGSVGFQLNGAGGISYDFNPFERAVANEWDFIGVALHEISHALGRISILGQGGDDSLLDRFRYRAAGQLQTSVTGSPAYFSLDGGATNLANFDTTNLDSSDWAPGGPDDANLAISYLGVANNFGQVDLRELNALGFQRVAQTDDFEGKGTSDIIWRNATTGALWEWRFANGAVASGVYLGVQSSYQIAGAGDFNGDGTTDLLWTNSTGDLWTWQMSNGRVSHGYHLGNVAGWNATIGHFSGGGVSDILWQNASTGAIWIWKMQNGQVAGSSYLGVQSAWTVAGAGDFNADGTTDVLLMNGAGQVWDWMMSNDAIVGAHNLGNVAGWSLIGSGDFNGDRTTDLLWRNNATHDVVEWLMANGLVHSTVNLGAVSGANVVATGDYFGTGTSDIVWQNTTSGTTTLWAMQNGQHMSAYDVNLGNSSGFKGV